MMLLTRNVRVATDLQPDLVTRLAVRVDVKLSLEALQDYATQFGDDAAWDHLAAAISAQLGNELKKAWAVRSQP